MSAPERPPGGPAAPDGAATVGEVRPAGPGRPLPVLLTGALLIGVPTVVALAHAAPGEEALEETGGVGATLLATLVLAVGALAVLVATVRPHSGPVPALTMLCALLGLVLEPPAAWADALCGLAALAYLLAVRLHRQSTRGEVDLGEWLRAHRPMGVGAAVTTPAVLVAAIVPSTLTLPVAGLLGLLLAGLAALLFTPR